MKNLYRNVIFFCATVALTTQHSIAGEKDDLAFYSERAVELLRDAISRETAHGQGLVPAYAESLKQVFLEAGFPPETLTIVPYGETASLVVGRKIDVRTDPAENMMGNRLLWCQKRR